ncbi:MAG: arylsulfatase A-like enzyme, partial [Chlamydiales bacterium]
MPTRNLPAILLLLTLSAACGSSAADPAPVERVFLLSCDTLRADRLGMYGYGPDVSPNLDALAAESTVFDEAYACAPMTQPAVSSLMSGRFPTEIGVTPGNRSLMPPQIETLAEAISANGIETAAVVSNYLLRKNQRQPKSGVAQGFDHFDDAMPDREATRGLKERTARHTTDAAISWLESYVERGAGRCFLWVHYQDPHGPYTPPEEHKQQFDRPAGAQRVEIGKSRFGHRVIPDYQHIEGSNQPEMYRARYDAEIHFFDEQLGRLVDWLDERSLLENSLLIFTADHGEALGEHDFWFCHGESLHREIVRIPFFVRAPDGFPLPAAGADGETRLAVSHLDVFPTVIDALGLAPVAGLRGESLLRSTWTEPRIVTQLLLPSPEKRPKWVAASDGQYRLIWNDIDNAKRLYDMRTDPGEEHDLAQEHPQRVEAL